MYKSFTAKLVGLGVAATLASAIIASPASASYLRPCTQTGPQIWLSASGTSISGDCFTPGGTVGFYMWRVNGVVDNDPWWTSPTVVAVNELSRESQCSSHLPDRSPHRKAFGQPTCRQTTAPTGSSSRSRRFTGSE